MLLNLGRTLKQRKHKIQTSWLSRDQSIYLVLRAAIELNHSCRHCDCLLVRVSYTTDPLINQC